MGQAPTERTISLPAGRTAGRGFRNYRVATKLRALDNNYGQVVNGLRRISAHLRTYGNPIEHCRQSAIFLFFSFQSVCGRKDGPAQFFPGRTRSNLRPPTLRPPSLTLSPVNFLRPEQTKKWRLFPAPACLSAHPAARVTSHLIRSFEDDSQHLLRGGYRASIKRL